ncbi:chorismate mutase [Aurantimonas sp. Leaf443]|uniref:chorismate mutase n=1 Tax=Aurantimonas sp. Leaf443 TaxID=1736378 RepID=UPI0006F80DC3|nr:chorismate mutase [Aurantimonas sp. Leaf443]KQT82221.1 chorismate mutase [Aurantimonas sp. Leaf443]
MDETVFGSALGGRLAETARAELLSCRRSIDNIDAALIHMLAERFRCTQRVGELKAAHHLPPADPERERQQIERLRRLAKDAELDPEFAETFLAFIVKEVIRHHEAIAARQAARAAEASGA